MWKKPLLIVLSINTLAFGRDLLPPFPDPLTVEPAIPENFVVGPNPDLYSGVIWGEQEALKRLQNSFHIDSVFFFVQLSGDIIQQNPTDFVDEFSLTDRFEQMGYSDIDIRKSFWEKHPVLMTQYTDNEGRSGYRAWIGLNSRIGGWVLSVSFQYPETETMPTSQELAIWKTFLQSPDFSLK